MGPGKGGVGRRRVADRPIAAEIARHVFVELRRTGRHRRNGLRHRRQDAVFDSNTLGSGSGGLDAVGDDHRHRIADVAHFALR